MNLKKLIDRDEVLRALPFYIVYRVVVRLRELNLLKKEDDG